MDNFSIGDDKRLAIASNFEKASPNVGGVESYGLAIQKASKEQQAKVHKVMKEFKDGTLTSNGKKVTSRDQAIAIAISEAGLSKSDYVQATTGTKTQKGKTMTVDTKEMIDEHKNLINTLESPSHKDDKKEAKKQKKELKEYKEKLNKAYDALGLDQFIEDLEKGKKPDPIGTIRNGKKKVAEGKWVSVGDETKPMEDKPKPGDDKKKKDTKNLTKIKRVPSELRHEEKENPADK